MQQGGVCPDRFDGLGHRVGQPSAGPQRGRAVRCPVQTASPELQTLRWPVHVCMRIILLRRTTLTIRACV